MNGSLQRVVVPCGGECSELWQGWIGRLGTDALDLSRVGSEKVGSKALAAAELEVT